MIKTIVTAQDVYDFQDLDKDAQEKVLQDLRDINTDNKFWHECIFDNYKEKLTSLGFNNPEIYFSGFWNQGDGACFDSSISITVELFEQFVKQLSDKKLLKMILHHENWFFDYLYNNCEFAIEKTDFANRYRHKKTRYVTGRITYDTITYGYLELCFDQFLTFLEDFRLKTSQEIYESLKKEYEYLTSDTTIIKIIEGNEYQFLVNGNIY